MLARARTPLEQQSAVVTLFLVDAATLPRTGSQAGIGRQLPTVLKVTEQALEVEHGSELRANALEPHK
jgi:hypothetical protein